MRLKWRKARQSLTDRALATNGAYAPPARYELVDEAETVRATIQRQGSGFTAQASGGNGGRFSELDRAKDFAKGEAQARLRRAK